MTIGGRRTTVFRHEEPGSADFTATWLEGDHALLLDGRFASVEDFRSVAKSIRRVDVNTWLSALPDSVVQPFARASSVESMLADVPLHPSIDVEGLKASPEVRDRYQLGAEVTGAVACAWIGQWVEAIDKADGGSAQQAVDAMATARNWSILNEMDEDGDWPEVVWEYADAMVSNDPVSGGRPLSVKEAYGSALGCENG